MKLITFFIILLTLLNYSNQDDPPPMRSYTYEFEKYDSFEFNEIKGVQIVLHLNKFDKGENFYYYFEFTEDDATNDEGNYIITFFEGQRDEIASLSDDDYSVYFTRAYLNSPKSIEKLHHLKQNFIFLQKKILNI